MNPLKLQRIRFFYMVWAIRLIYIISALRTLDFLSRWNKFVHPNSFQPLWPVAWVPTLTLNIGFSLIVITAFSSALFSAVSPRFRLPRILAALGFLELIAYLYSTRPIGHGNHAILWTLILFSFIPRWSPGPSRKERQNTLWWFWGTQSLILLFYTLSGFWKLYYGSAWISSSLPIHLTNKSTEIGESSVFSQWLLYHPVLASVCYMFVILLELGSFPIAFAPATIPFWGVLLMLFHLAVYLAMGISFLWSAVLLFPLFVLPSVAVFLQKIPNKKQQ